MSDEQATRGVAEGERSSNLALGLSDGKGRQSPPATALRRRPQILPFAPLSFPDAGPGALRIVIYGVFAEHWSAGLGAEELWRGMDGVGEVVNVYVGQQWPKTDGSISDERTVVIPVGAIAARYCPAGYRGLRPDRRAILTLANKDAFARYVEAHGLAWCCPATYRSKAEFAFPCLLKHALTNNGSNIEIVDSFAQLQSLLAEPRWRLQRFIVQELVPGDTEYVTHCVCKDGRILWHHSFSYAMGAQTAIRRGADPSMMSEHLASEADLAQIEALLAPLRFNGPCNLDYKRRSDGTLCVFEINPRLGGSLMHPATRAQLREALSCIIKHARDDHAQITQAAM